MSANPCGLLCPSLIQECPEIWGHSRVAGAPGGSIPAVCVSLCLSLLLRLDM